MRSTVFLLAAASSAHATWLRWSVNREHVWAAQETGHISESEATGWTPIPTPAPGLRSESEIVLDLLRRQQKTSETDWTNPETCGWFSGVSSSAVMCGNDFTCATNSNNVVACASGTFSPFYTACLDYRAFQAGSCTSLGAATGCCQQEAEPACGTYLWTGQPERSMYKCFETASIVTILDVPQFVVDASLFSKTHTTATPTITKSGTATDGSSSPDNTGGVNPGSDLGSGSDGSSGNDGKSGGGSGGSSGDSGSGSGTDKSSNNTPVIVGSVIGGVAGLLLLLLLLLCLTRKTKGKLGLSYSRNKNNKQKAHATNAYHTTNLTGAAAKGRSSSGSEAMSVVPAPAQQPQHHYYNQEQHHYHPQAQAQPQAQPQQQAPPPQYQAGTQQPVPMAYTVNQGAAHTSHPPYSSTTSYATTNPASGAAAPNFVVAGVVPVSNDKQQYSQPQAQFQQQAQPQQQAGLSQMQPVNHIHVYYAVPPAQGAAQGTSYTYTQATPAADTHSTHTTHSRDSPSTVPDALGLYTQYQDHGPGYRQSF